jgi:hypothetical protein
LLAAAVAAATFTCPTPTFAQLGIHSPLFPQGLSPQLGMALTSPGRHPKWGESGGIDPELWFDGDGAPLGSVADFFKDDPTSIFAAQAEQDDGIAAW